MLVQIHPDNPQERLLNQVIDILRKGGVIIYPTDTVYGIGCDIFNAKAVERIARLKGVKIEKANFSIICQDLSHLSEYARHVDNTVFKLMRRLLPGPYTFILQASSKVPRIFKNKKKTIGIRIPNNNICLEIVRMLGNPILTTSIHDSDEIMDYATDPELIHDNYQNQVDLVIDGGYGNLVPSTVLDCTDSEIEVIREGAGEIDF
jgi:tRNA threonylcarbamoyl adenosine modification protein (Sua5/YciO/YrdC/YwlC family)